MIIPRDWTLLVIAAAPSSGALAPVQLQKALFLLSENLRGKIKGAGFHTFEPYDYGPFSSHIYQDAEALEALGLITIRRPPEVRYNQFSVTEAGRARADRLRSELSEDARRYVDDVVAWCLSLSFNALVAAIYDKYPAMRANSVFQG